MLTIINDYVVLCKALFVIIVVVGGLVVIDDCCRGCCLLIFNTLPTIKQSEGF